MSRSLKLTWPFSSRWIFHSDARIALPACSRERPLAVRSRRSSAPTSMRRTVGPARSGWNSLMSLYGAPPTGGSFGTMIHMAM
jgi:hypothetical protein